MWCNAHWDSTNTLKASKILHSLQFFLDIIANAQQKPPQNKKQQTQNPPNTKLDCKCQRCFFFFCEKWKLLWDIVFYRTQTVLQLNIVFTGYPKEKCTKFNLASEEEWRTRLCGSHVTIHTTWGSTASIRTISGHLWKTLVFLGFPW